jgi:HEAT repeat protein
MYKPSNSWRFALLLAVLANSSGNHATAEGLSIPTEKQLIETLHSGKPEDKAIACKQLAIRGSKAAVPELAKLLADKQLASWARIALEAIPDPSADEALILAARDLPGELGVGAINSIGVRKSANAAKVLTELLKENDTQVASAAAVALGRIGDENARGALRQSLAATSPAVRSAVAEGCVLCAEQLLANGKNDQAAELYDQIRKADVPKQRMLEATRGVIIARGKGDVPLLVEQLESTDKKRFGLGLKVAREVEGPEVTEALAAELAKAPPERAALIVAALGDRGESKLSPTVLQAAREGDRQVRLAAIQVVGRAGDASALPALIDIATGDDADLSAAAKEALATVPGERVNKELASRLPEAKGKTLDVLIELVGKRRINAVAELIKVFHSSDDATRNAALVALGATAGPADLPLLISEVTSAKNGDDSKLAEKALQTACVRMPDRETTSAELAKAMPHASASAKASLLRILGAMGGPKALATVAAAVKEGDPEQQDVGTRVLGEWMTADAAPILLEITKSSVADKYRVRALRGYLRIARQQKMPDAERLAMFRQGLELAKRPEERELTLDILKRCPSTETIQLASSFMDDQQLRQHAVETAIFIAEKIKDKDPAAARTAAEKALKADPNGKLAERARALTKAP